MNLLAYHVSRVPGVETLHPSICDDESRDDQLCGASVVCFTTTLRDGKLPKTSTYSRSVIEGTMVYRYSMEFNPKNFFIFLMAKTTLNKVDQVHFLLLKRDAGREEQIAKFLKKQQLYRRETKRETSVSGSVVLRSVEEVQVTPEGSKRAWKRYFPDGKPNDFCSDTRSGGRAFVNVMFWHKVQVQHLDEVEKQGYKFPPSEGNVGKSPWLEKLLERYPDERMRYDYQKDEARVRMLWIERNERERSEFETEKSIFEEEKAEFEEEMAKKKKKLASEKKAFEKAKQAFNKEKAELLKMAEEKLKTENPNKETKLNVETLKRDKKAPERKTSKEKKSTNGPPENDTATQSHDEKTMAHTKGLEKRKKKQGQGHEAKGFSGNSDKKHTRKQEEEKKTSLKNQEIGDRGDENAINKKTKKSEVQEKKKKKATKLRKKDFQSEDKP